MKKHLWYLSEELTAFAFFDSSVSINIKLKMVESLKTKESVSQRKRIEIDCNNLDLMCTKEISDFVTKRSFILFEQLKLSSDFLNLSPTEWPNDPNYLSCLSIFKNIKVVNDIAERGVALVEEFNQFATKDEEQKQYL